MFVFAKEKEEKKYEILNKLNHNSEILWIIQCDEDEKCVSLSKRQPFPTCFFSPDQVKREETEIY